MTTMSNVIGFRPTAHSATVAATPPAPPPAAAPTKKFILTQRVSARLDDGRSFSRVFEDDDDGALEYAKELARIGLTLIGKTNVLIYPVHRIMKVDISYEPRELAAGEDDEAEHEHEEPCDCGRSITDAVSDTEVDDLNPADEEFDCHGRTDPRRLPTPSRRLRYRCA